MERPNRRIKRMDFLRKIKKCREEMTPIFCLDEIWIDTHTYPGKQWQTPKGKVGCKLPTIRGQRSATLHCGSKESGFLDGCYRVFRSKADNEREYPTELKGPIFTDWVKEKLTPGLPPPSPPIQLPRRSPLWITLHTAQHPKRRH